MKKRKYSKHLTQATGQEPLPRKKKTLLYVLGGFIILLMVGSLIGFFGNDTTTPDTYGTFAFTPYGIGWATTLQNQNLVFAYHPQELAQYSHAPFPQSSLYYLAFDPALTNENDQTLQRIKAYLDFTGKITYYACIREQGCGDLPIVTCKDTNTVLYWKQGNTTQTFRDQNCYVLEHAPDNELLTTELAAYQILGIIQ